MESFNIALCCQAPLPQHAHWERQPCYCICPRFAPCSLLSHYLHYECANLAHHSPWAPVLCWLWTTHTQKQNTALCNGRVLPFLLGEYFTAVWVGCSGKAPLTFSLNYPKSIFWRERTYHNTLAPAGGAGPHILKTLRPSTSTTLGPWRNIYPSRKQLVSFQTWRNVRAICLFACLRGNRGIL